MKRLDRALSTALMASLLVSAPGILLTGCAWADEHRVAAGAITGTVIGAALGAAIDDKSERGAVIGGLAGAAIGTGIGLMLQRQKDEFDRIEDVETRQQTVVFPQQAPAGAPSAPAPPPVEREALNIRIQNRILFPTGSSALTSRGVIKINEIARVLGEYPESDVYIQGYTNSEGDDRANMALSQRRADVVKNQLISQQIVPSRVFALGMGASNPVATEATEAGRTQNRRVEIDVVPRG